jgi:DNA polymerase
VEEAAGAVAEAVAAAETAAERASGLAALADATSSCTLCALAEGRTQVVFGTGDPNAKLMFVGEAPGYHEDKQGYPFVGQAGKLLDKLLAGIELTRDDVFIANVLKCRPPGNRDPQQVEIEACEQHLFKQVALIEPRLIATLGNFATKLLSGRPDGITKVHGEPREATLGDRTVTLYPLFHPAAALYTPAMMKTLEADFARIPGLLGVEDTDRIGPALEVPADVPEAGEAIPAGVGVPSHDLAVDPDEQLDLF